MFGLCHLPVRDSSKTEREKYVFLNTFNFYFLFDFVNL